MYDELAPVVKTVYEWVKANPELALTLAKVALAITALSSAVSFLNPLFSIANGLIMAAPAIATSATTAF